MIVVLAGALHWGRNGGFGAAVLAAAVYVALRIPLLSADGLTDDALALIAIRVGTYAVIGVIGGEVAGRLKYLLARLENGALVDPVTGAYSACHAGASIVTAIAAFDRYGTPFSVVALGVSPSLNEGARPRRVAQVMRHLAGALRNDIRLVDDLAYRGDGRFLVLLPNTDSDGADVVAARLKRLASDTLEARDGIVAVETLSCSTTHQRLSELAHELHPADALPVQGCPSATSGGRRAVDRT
jgi:GGDEF domain-containing protein